MGEDYEPFSRMWDDPKSQPLKDIQEVIKQRGIPKLTAGENIEAGQRVQLSRDGKLVRAYQPQSFWGKDESNSELQRLINALIERYRVALDEMCHAMLKDHHKRGVLVTFGPGWVYRIELSHSVPWCEIHEKNNTTIEVY